MTDTADTRSEAERRAELKNIRDAAALAEHKVDQHLQGQYNHYPYAALGTALMSLRSALTLIDAASRLERKEPHE